MSKHNKVNKDHYTQDGRLTPDDMARERMNQAQISPRARSKENVIGKKAKGKSGPAPTLRRTGRGE
jgi:hypothetical protein